ncbi:DUF2771 domain-containing protein [Streptomyces sp. NBC_01304]|uniref:DUF2771 domain-containing protein n=1 Tax=Streptomyces sp. NBC_01304 TaxID=2903818 RepID=UPI002E0D43E0|nr:DUF2771 domain-containing protein [Streptomyces sp. NBC_01304]
MTSLLSSAKARRTAAALGAVSAGLLVLSACEKPSPMATLTVGDKSVSSEASCYAHSKTLADGKIQDCLQKGGKKTLTVGMDDKVRFGVDPEVADNGWVLFVNGKPIEGEAYKKTYRSIPGSVFFSSGQDAMGGQTAPLDKAKVAILELKDKSVKGVWQFEFKKGK